MNSSRNIAHPRRQFALLLGLLLLLSFPLVIVGLKSFFIRDFAVFGYPLAYFHKTEIWSGRFPLWNPLNYCGVPHLAQWNTLLLYPGSLIYLLFPLPWSLNIFCLLHQLLGGLGMHRLIQSLTRDPAAAAISGIAYAFGGLTLNSLMWPNNIAALGLLPWVLLGVLNATRGNDRRGIAIASMVGAVQMLTGAPEIILTTWIFTGTLLIVDGGKPGSDHVRRGARLLIVVALISLIAAAQLIPFFELLHFADRAANEGNTAWSASTSCWVNFLLPGYQGNSTQFGYPLNHFQKWSLSFYPGMLTLLFAALAFQRHQRLPLLFGCLAFGGLTLASGHYSEAYKWLAEFLPLDLMRYPAKFLLFPVIALPVLAGLGYARVNREPPPRRTLLAVAIGGVLLFALAVFMDQNSQAARPERATKTYDEMLRGLAMLLGISALLLQPRFHKWSPLFLIFLLWGDLNWHMPALTRTVISSAYQDAAAPLCKPPGRIHTTHAAWTGLYALDSTNAQQYLRGCLHGRSAQLNLLHGEAAVGGFLSLPPPQSRELGDIVAGSDWRRVNPVMADFLGVSNLGRWTNEIIWSPRDTAAPIITSGQKPAFASTEAQLEHMRQPDFNPLNTVCLDTESRALVGSDLTQAAITIHDFSAHEIRFEAESVAPSLAVIAQSWYPAWRAQINGKEVPILRANLQFQAVPLPAGHSEVILRYDRGTFHLGVLLSLAGLAATLWLWCTSSSRPPHDDPSGVGKCEGPVGGQ